MRTFGIIKPDGNLATPTVFFTNRSDAADFAVSMYNDLDTRRFGKDGSDLDWKRMKRQGWAIAPFKHIREQPSAQ